MAYDLPLTLGEYGPNLCQLRKIISMDRAKKLSELHVTNEHDFSLKLYINHFNLYIVAIDFGAGPFRFRDPDAPAIKGARDFEFGGSYMDLNLHAERLELSYPLLTSAVTELSHHRPKGRGSGFFLRRKQAVVRLIFAISEALRFWKIQNAVEELLRNPTASLFINDFAGDQQPLNSWEAWSRNANWADKGIFVPAVKG